MNRVAKLANHILHTFLPLSSGYSANNYHQANICLLYNSIQPVKFPSFCKIYFRVYHSRFGERLIGDTSFLAEHSFGMKKDILNDTSLLKV